MALVELLLLLGSAAGVAARGFWSSQPALYDNDNVIAKAYPVGNGRLGAMPYGAPAAQVVNLNVDSLWNGGPFGADNYTGGNPTSEVYTALPDIRSFIFQNGTGNVDALLGGEFEYGSYQVLGNLSVLIDGLDPTTKYNRSLDFDTGLHTTTFVSGNSTYTSTVYCSFPDQVCVYSLSSSQELPAVSFKVDNELVDTSVKKTSCGLGFVRLSGVTQLGPPEGMKYDAIARILSTSSTSTCNNATGYLTVPRSSGSKTLSLIIGAGTNYDQTKGNAASDFSFKGEDPASYVEQVTSQASGKSETAMRAAHVADYSSLADLFNLSIPDTTGSTGAETATLLSSYNQNDDSNPYLEATLFDFGRHLFISSSRENSLPPNLQGNWATDLSNAWSGDYHANINLQMNHWGVPETGLASLQTPLWNYMQNTWVPRGQETAQLLYGTNASSSAWVLHDEINIFGHTAMKEAAQWANYPASGAWMMQHVYDQWSFTRNTTFLATQGYPLLQSSASFWASQLSPDTFTNDSTLVVNPCNSPEHGPTTFGCTHYQQLLHQLFTAVLLTSPYVPSSIVDSSLISEITTSLLPALDKGLHLSSFNTLKEWKLPDTYGYDVPNDTHRHLSHLVGWYPGYSLSSYLNGTSNSTIRSAVSESLLNRGLGNGPDANSGWEKVWRAACWARLGEAESAYEEVRYAISENFAANGISLYSGGNGGAPGGPFQIDANFGIVGAVVGMVSTDLPEDIGDTSTHEILLGPAIPAAWGGGSVQGLRIRGGGQVAFSWDMDGVVTEATVSERDEPLVVVNKNGTVLARV